MGDCVSTSTKTVIQKEQSSSLKVDGSSKQKVMFTAIGFMGLSHILYFKQYMKGILYGLVEIIVLLSSPIWFGKIVNLITLGTPQPDLAVKQ